MTWVESPASGGPYVAGGPDVPEVAVGAGEVGATVAGALEETGPVGDAVVGSGWPGAVVVGWGLGVGEVVADVVGSDGAPVVPVGCAVDTSGLVVANVNGPGP